MFSTDSNSTSAASTPTFQSIRPSAYSQHTSQHLTHDDELHSLQPLASSHPSAPTSPLDRTTANHHHHASSTAFRMPMRDMQSVHTSSSSSAAAAAVPLNDVFHHSYSSEQQQPQQQLHSPSTKVSTAASSSSTGSYAPIHRRTKDKQKHSESENRRRQRLRAKFAALQEATGPIAVGAKTDRYSILTSATERIKQLDAKLLASEQEKLALITQLNTQNHHYDSNWNGNSSSTMLGNVGSVALNNTADIASFPALSTPLQHYSNLSSFAACYISLDGRILDANNRFTTLFEFERSTHANANTEPFASSHALENNRADAISSSTTSLSSSSLDAAAAVSSSTSIPSVDLYSSSIFSLTHPNELLHTLSILRNLLCGISEGFSCVKQCLTVRGQALECQMNVASVIHKSKIVMFLCLFVPLHPRARSLNHQHHVNTNTSAERASSAQTVSAASQLHQAASSQQQQQQQTSFQPTLYATVHDVSNLHHPHARHLTSPQSQPPAADADTIHMLSHDRSMSVPQASRPIISQHGAPSAHLSTIQQQMSRIQVLDQQLQQQQQTLEERMIDRSPEMMENAAALSALHHQLSETTLDQPNQSTADSQQQQQQENKSTEARPDTQRLFSVSSVSSQPPLLPRSSSSSLMDDTSADMNERPLSPQPHVAMTHRRVLSDELNSAQAHTLPELGRPLSNMSETVSFIMMSDFQRTPSMPTSVSHNSFQPNSSPIFQLRESPSL